MPPKRVRSASLEGQPSKKAKRATGKTSTNTTKATKATAADPTAQAGTSEDGQNTAPEALARKPAGRPAAGSRPSARGRKKANDKVNPESGEQANPDDAAAEAKNGGLAPAMKTDDSVEVALDLSDSNEGATNDLSRAEGAPTQDRTSKDTKSANLADAAAGNTTHATSQDIQAAGQEATTTAADHLTPTHDHGPRSDGQRLGRDSGLSSCDSENTGEEDHFMAGVPFHPIRWQRPVPSRVSAAGTTATTKAWAKPLVPKPMDALPNIEKRSEPPSLHGGDTVGSRVTEPLSEADATHQQPSPSLQQETTTSAGVVTEQPPLQQPFIQRPFIQQPFIQQPPLQQPPLQRPFIQQPVPQTATQPVAIGSNTEPGETPKLFGHNTAPVHTTADDPTPVPQNPALALNVDVSQLPRSFFDSLERFLNDDLPATSVKGLWLRGVQCGIGHGLATLKRVFLSEIEHRGSLFGHAFPLDPGQTRSEQRRAIEANVMFDRLVANHAGETFVKSQSKARKRRHDRRASLFQAARREYEAIERRLYPEPTPTQPNLPHFPTNPMGAGGLAAQGPGYPQSSPRFSQSPAGLWRNPPSNATATQNYNIGVEKKPEDGSFAESAAFPDGLPQPSTVWRGGEFPLASPQLTTTKDGRAVISMSRRQGRDCEAGNDEAGDGATEGDEAGDDETEDDEAGDDETEDDEA